tara:strand:+ start:634 stop:1092 length:459 start_codon:yes stop_codon:yes gene_type:complete
VFKKVLVYFISVLIIFNPIYAQAEELEGRVTSLSINESAPYAGILLDSIAASKMLVDQKYLKLEIELELRKEFQKELSDKRLAFDLLQTEYDALKKIHKETILLKNQQINDLNEFLKEEMGDDYAEWWIAAGVALGIILSVSVFYASVEVVK